MMFVLFILILMQVFINIKYVVDDDSDITKHLFLEYRQNGTQ